MKRPGTAALLAELRKEMKSRGLRVGQLADMLGVAEPTVWRWLRGEGLTLDRMDEICGLLDIDLRDLVSRGEPVGEDAFTLAQERVLAADRGLALVFFAILHGAQLRDLAAERPTALLCFEREPHGCHRSLLIDAVMPEATVTHLFT